MDFLEGTFVRVVFALLFAGILLRLILFAVSLGREAKSPLADRSEAGFLRSMVPYHRGMAKNPVNALLGYLFHVCLILVPLGFSGHIALWSDSPSHWSLPTPLVDAMTIVVVIFSIFYLVRRIFLKRYRQESSPSDYVLIVLTGLPFVNGFLLSHVNGSTPFRVAHILAGSAFILMTIFLLLRPRVREKTCTACASCAVQCPGHALKSRDEGDLRMLEYTPARCIVCGGCVAVCPEGAAGLRHVLGFRGLLRRFAGERLHAAAMETCPGCGERFAPLPQVEKIGRETAQEQVRYCERCKRERVAREKLLSSTLT
jgi:Pyruvate/2-oxoacid:ferredoxin oxidoreductase delta subunit